MKKEIQDLAWSVLPKEFKEEVKKEWQSVNNEGRLKHDVFLRGCYSTMVWLFGYHNLTSDVEGEEKNNKCEICGSQSLSICAHTNCQDYNYQPAPKFKVGCKVISKDGYIGVVDCIQEKITRVVRKKEDSRWFAHGDLGPYTGPEPTDGYAECVGDNRFEVIWKAKDHMMRATNIEGSAKEMEVLDSFLFRCWQLGWLKQYDTPHGNRNLSQDAANCDISRLQIAAMAMKGLISDWVNAPQYTTTTKETVRERLARESLCFADTLITVAKKGECK